jgi:hypothetical protein
MFSSTRLMYFEVIVIELWPRSRLMVGRSTLAALRA